MSPTRRAGTRGSWARYSAWVVSPARRGTSGPSWTFRRGDEGPVGGVVGLCRGYVSGSDDGVAFSATGPTRASHQSWSHAMKRRTLDVIVSAGGLVLAGLL